MRVVAKIVLLVIIMTLIFVLATSIVNLADIPKPDDIKEGELSDLGEAKDGFANLGGKIVRYIWIAGVVLSVLILALFGIKWFMATPQEKAILQDRAWSYVIGSVLVFGGMSLMGWVAEAMSKVFGD